MVMYVYSIIIKYYNLQRIDIALKKLNLIRPITSISGEPKFRFKDKEIEDLFAAIWEVHAMGEFWLLMKKWSYFDKPTEEELIRLETLLGKVESERIKKLCDRTRSKTIVALKKSKTIYEFIRYLVENREITFLDVPPTISNGYNEYALYLKENDPDKYKKEIPSRTKVLCAKYDPFFNRALERLMKTRRHTTALSQKDKIKEVRDYYQTLRTIEYEYLKSLPHDFHETILEEIKMEFRDAISRYSFLDDIVKDVCPQILEQPDYELQDKITAGEVEKQKGYVKLAKRMHAIFPGKRKWHNLKSKSGKKVPYKPMRIRSPQTGKFVKIYAPDLTEISGW